MLFRNRLEAGKALAEPLMKYAGGDVIVLGIPRGGVSVGYPVAKALDAPLDVIISKKLPVPWSPEVGFGAVTSAGDVILNPDIADRLCLTEEEIKGIAEGVCKEVQRRMRVYRGDKPLPSLRGKTVIITDDGLATGFTMVAAVESARRQGSGRVVAAVPVSPKDAADAVRGCADEVVTLWEKPVSGFAVASFYKDFHDMDDGEVVQLLKGF